MELTYDTVQNRIYRFIESDMTNNYISEKLLRYNLIYLQLPKYRNISNKGIITFFLLFSLKSAPNYRFSERTDIRS